MKDLTRRSFLIGAGNLGMLLVSKPTIAEAQQYTSSNFVSYVEGGITYRGRTTLSISPSSASGSSYIESNDRLPAGYMGADVFLTCGSVVVDQRTQYNGSPSYNLTVIASATKHVGSNYYTSGNVRCYNQYSGSYVLHGLISCPIITARSSSTFNSIKTNERGSSFGSVLADASTLDELDYLEVIATNGKEGYVRRSDWWTPIPASPQEASTAFLVERSRSIPVFDFDEQEIGTFELHYGGTSD